MSIIYSYPTVQPAADDLLIGTDVGSDNATKSFTISSVASLVGEIASAGTVNSVQIATDAFLSAVGGPITSSGTITIGLTALGTPSTNTFLRGDNRWVTPTVSAGIYAFNQNTQITDDISSINFRGSGVVASSAPDGSVTVQIDGDSGGVNSITQGTGISVNQTTGDVEITNTGVTRLTAGSNITLSANTGNVTISSSGGTGGVSIVSAGTGLTLQAGDSQSNPTIAVDYAGANNFIRLGENPEVITADDFMLFEDVVSGDVKSTTLGTIPTSALTLVQDTINTTVSNPFVVKNNTDIYPSIPTVFQVITLTQAEYTALSTTANPPGPGYNSNTLYLIGTGLAQVEKTLAITNTINGTEYTLGGDQAGLIKTGAVGSDYEFNTTVTPNDNFTFGNTLVISDAAGTYDTDGIVTTTISGTVSAVDPGTCTANLFDSQGNTTIVNGLTIKDGAVENVNYEITSTTNTISGTCGTSSFTSDQFGVAVSLVSGQNANQWEIIGPDNLTPIAVGNGITYSPVGGDLNGSTPVTCTITGTIKEKTYDLEYNLTDTNTSTDYSIVNSMGLNSTVNYSTNNAPGVSTITGKYSDVWEIVTTYRNNSGVQSSTTIDPNTVDFGNLSNGNTILSNGTLSGGFTQGTDIVLNQDLTSITAAIAGPAQFRLTALNQNVQDVDDNDGVQNKGFTYASSVQYRVNNGPLNDIAVSQTYILASEGDLITLSYAEPAITPNSGFYIEIPFSTNINITDGTSNYVNQFTAVADKSYDIAVTQTGGVTNRRGVSGRSGTFVVNESEACGLTLQTINTFLSKPSNPTAPATPWVPEVGNYSYDSYYGFNAFADGWYRANLTVTQGTGALPTNPGKYQLLSNRVNAASACPAEGTAVFVLNNDITGTSNGYSLSTTYTVTPPGGSPVTGPIPYTGAVTAVENSVITFTSTAQAFGSYVWQSGPTFTPASGIVTATIQANAQVTATALVEGDIVSVAEGAVAGPHPADYEACQDQAYETFIFYIGSSSGPEVGNVFYTNKNQGVLINPLANGHYRFDNSDRNWFRIQDGAGTVSQVGTCPNP